MSLNRKTYAMSLKQVKFKKDIEEKTVGKYIFLLQFFLLMSPILLLKTTATALQTLSSSHFTEISLILPETVAQRSFVKKGV